MAGEGDVVAVEEEGSYGESCGLDGGADVYWRDGDRMLDAVSESVCGEVSDVLTVVGAAGGVVEYLGVEADIVEVVSAGCDVVLRAAVDDAVDGTMESVLGGRLGAEGEPMFLGLFVLIRSS